MIKTKLNKNRVFAIAVIGLFAVAIFVFYFNQSNKIGSVTPIDSTSFTINNIAVTAGSIDTMCQSRFKSLAPDFKTAISYICDARIRNIRSYGTGDIDCKCNSYDTSIIKPRNP